MSAKRHRAIYRPQRISLVERSLFSVKSLFAERPKGAKRSPDTMFFRFDDGKTLEVRFTRQLGAFHLLVLEAFIAEAQAELDWESPAGPEQLDRDMREKMELEAKAAVSDNLTVTLSFYAAAACMGRKPSTILRRQIEEALLDLSGCQFIWRQENGRPIESFHLLSYLIFSKDSEKGPVKISICPALSEVIRNARPYTRVNMDEVRALEHRPTVLLHGWLSSIVQPGQTSVINIDTILDDKIWAEKAEKGTPTYRTRRSTLMNKLLPDMENAGWKWEYDATKDQVRVSRPEWVEKAAKKRKAMPMPASPDCVL